MAKRAPKHGDIFISAGMIGFSGDETTRTYRMFEFREGEETGKGFFYTPSGKSTYYFWARPSESVLFENVPDDILYSFQHGSNEFTLNDKQGAPNLATEDYIRMSDFKFVTPEDIEKAKRVEAIETFDQVIFEWEFIKAGNHSVRIMILCLQALCVKIPECQNGELGLQMLNIMELYKANLPMIDSMIKAAKGG